MTVLDPVDTYVDPVDDDTAAAANRAFTAAYAAARKIAVPRLYAWLQSQGTVAAAAGGDQFITDQEWATIVEANLYDALGDGLLDGIVAGAATFGTLVTDSVFAKAFKSVVSGIWQFAGEIRDKLGHWITSKVGEGVTGDWGPGELARALVDASPLSPDKALIAAGMGGPTNAGLHAAMEVAGVAAIRWITQRDERVRPAHAAADTDTIPTGQTFDIGGYPARFPGDPLLPIGMRINCRCTLAYVDGSEVRRVIGSTKVQLRAKAAELSIGGRSKMSKGALQMAVLKSLCLQGRAGGPDCPDRFDEMNKPALLALARNEGIVGRYRMSREQLVFTLREYLRGGDTAMVARGYSTGAEFGAAQSRAAYKRGRSTAEFATGIAPSATARRALRDELFTEFGGPQHGSVPCVHCGLRLDASGAAGLAVLVPEPLVPWSQGGGLALSNFVPACPSCFVARGGRGGGLVASAAEFGNVATEARIPAGSTGGGRWTDGGLPLGPNISPRIDRTAAGKKSGKRSTLGPHSHLTDFTTDDQTKMASDFAKVTGLTHLKTAEDVVQFLTDETDRQMAAALANDPDLTARYWYNAAHSEASQISERLGATSTALGAGLIAVTSPQTPYPDNVAMAREIANLYGRDGTNRITEKMLRQAYTDPNNKELKASRAAMTEEQFVATLRTATWGTIGTRLGGAIFKSHLQYAHPPILSVDQVLTKGGHGAYTETFGERVVAKSGESGYKALEILNAHRDYGDTQAFTDVLSNRLGDGSKVRSFYNNINNPDSADYVTIDTHAAAGMTGFPGGSGSPFVRGVMSHGSTTLGMSQSYPLYQEAINRVAAKYKVLPREVQSITWIQQRDVEWPDTVKSKYVGTGTPKNPQVSHLQYQLAISAHGPAGVRRGRVYRDRVRDLLRERANPTVTRARVAQINAQLKALNTSLGLSRAELRAARHLAAPPAVYSAERKAGVTVP